MTDKQNNDPLTMYIKIGETVVNSRLLARIILCA